MKINGDGGEARISVTRILLPMLIPVVANLILTGIWVGRTTETQRWFRATIESHDSRLRYVETVGTGDRWRGSDQERYSQRQDRIDEAQNKLILDLQKMLSEHKEGHESQHKKYHAN